MRRGGPCFGSLVVVASVAAGCLGPGADGDAGADTGTEAAGQDGGDAGPSPPPVRVCTATDPNSCPYGGASMNGPADFGCLSANAPLPGAPVAALVRLEVWDPRAGGWRPDAFRHDLANRPIALFPGTEVRATCDRDCVMVTTDAAGVASVTLPAGSWFGYRLAAWGSRIDETATVLGYLSTFPSTADESATVTGISRPMADIVVGQLNRELTDESSVLAGAVTDCDGAPVANVAIRMFRATEICPGGCAVEDVGMPRVTGLDDATIPRSTPDGRTGYAGRFAGLVATAGGPVRIEAYGLLEEGAAPVLLGCEEVLVEGNAVTIAVIPPRRSDYPAGHGCAGRV